MVKCFGKYGTPKTIIADVHILFFFEDEQLLKKQIEQLDDQLRKAAVSLIEKRDFAGKDDEAEMLFVDAQRYLFVGFGSSSKLTHEMMRRAGARAVKKCSQYAVEAVAMYLPQEENITTIFHHPFEEVVQSFIEGAVLALYKFDAYKEKKKDQTKDNIREIQIVSIDEGYQNRLKHAIERSMIICEGVQAARNLSNAPGNRLNAETLSKEATTLTKKHGVKTIIFKKDEIESHKMGGVLAVNRGSKNEPRFIIMEYNADKRKHPCIVLVGKGITFDSGGISIKPSANMSEMKMDMSGAAAVIATLYVIARLKMAVRVVGLIPATDNMPSGSALCPGDIIQISNGKFVEVDNTDAEGRLILADALVYAQRYRPAAIIDLATLTGAVVVALGQHATGIMGNNEELKSKIKSAGEKTYERVCELPLYEEYEKQLKSDVADLKNLGGKWAGAITAAMFLKHFVGDYPWVHLDIAGTAMLEENDHYAQKGASGVGVRLLTEFLMCTQKG